MTVHPRVNMCQDAAIKLVCKYAKHIYYRTAMLAVHVIQCVAALTQVENYAISM